MNRRLDTTVVETGIFSFLTYGYPIETPAKLVMLMKQAARAEKAGDSAQARNEYQSAVSFYEDNWLKRKSGFENNGFSDLNEYLEANINVAILASYAFEKLGRLPDALAALAPFMANVEAEKSKIQLRYIRLCIQQYGRIATRQALDSSGQTVYRIPSEDSPELDYWRVKVFGANLGVAAFNTDTLSPQRAQAIIEHQPFYALVK